MKKPTMKNIKCINVKNDTTHITYEINNKQLGKIEKTIEITTPFKIYESQIDYKRFDWSNICFHGSIGTMFNDIVKIEIWYANGTLDGIVKDTVVVYTKKFNISFDQFHTLKTGYQSNSDISLVKRW